MVSDYVTKEPKISNYKNVEGEMRVKNGSAKGMIILDLVLKGHWFDLIANGKKRVEYREIKSYWTRRLFSRPFTHVRLRRGYTAKSLLFDIEKIERISARNDLNLPEVYAISLGSRIK